MLELAASDCEAVQAHRSFETGSFPGTNPRSVVPRLTRPRHLAPDKRLGASIQLGFAKRGRQPEMLKAACTEP